MSEHQYDEAYSAGYRVGYGNGRHEGLRKAEGEFWCGVCAGLATWPVAAVGYLVWRAFS